jgi:hypothetical protein
VTGLMVGPRVSQRDLALLPMSGGRWLRRAHLAPVSVLRAGGSLVGVLVGIYLVTDAEDRVVWLGQARREFGVAARLRDHIRHGDRLAVFEQVRVLELDEFTPPGALNACEGKAADVLRLRGRLGQRRWPESSGWADLCLPADPEPAEGAGAA